MTNVQEFTGWQYLLIDAANNYGLDKLTFAERIQWAEDNLDQLEQLAEVEGTWKEKPLYLKAVQAIRKAQAGEPIGHLVGLDAVCSGIQIMSAITGCKAGGKATGLVNTGLRPDAYTECTKIMSYLSGVDHSTDRKKIKMALMTHLYGSKQEPENLFGKDTPELELFYKAMFQLAPGASQLLTGLINTWQPYALNHSWTLPDGFDVDIKVMETVEKRVEVDELNGASFTYQYKVNAGSKRGVKNAANITHSLDAYLLRSLIRRCNYDLEWTSTWLGLITELLLERTTLGTVPSTTTVTDDRTRTLLHRYSKSLMADISILDDMEIHYLNHFSNAHLRKLAGILDSMLAHEPFPIITVHDDFKAHPSDLNHVRKHYRNILAELAESEVLADIMEQVTGNPVSINKLSQDLPEYIRNSNYCIC